MTKKTSKCASMRSTAFKARSELTPALVAQLKKAGLRQWRNNKTGALTWIQADAGRSFSPHWWTTEEAAMLVGLSSEIFKQLQTWKVGPNFYSYADQVLYSSIDLLLFVRSRGGANTQGANLHMRSHAVTAPRKITRYKIVRAPNTSNPK